MPSGNTNIYKEFNQKIEKLRESYQPLLKKYDDVDKQISLHPDKDELANDADSINEMIQELDKYNNCVEID